MVTAGRQRTTRARGSGRAATLVTALVVAVAVAACGSSAAPSSAGNATSPATSTTSAASVSLPSIAPPAPVSWTTCPNDPTLQCGTVAVPVDYRHPHSGTIEVAVTRSLSLNPADPRGTLVFNPGGPGESGNQILHVVLGLFPSAVRQDFDIVSFDPRGTGASDRLDCGTSPSAVTSVVPVPTGKSHALPGTPVFAAMAKACAERAPSLTPSLDSINTARDLDRIRQALGLAKISYYGISYGTVLGAAYAELFPSRIGSMVLDGAVDVNASLATQAAEEAPAAERSLTHLFTECAAGPSCPLGPHPELYWKALAASLTAHPLPAPGGADGQPVTVGDLYAATLLALSVPASTDVYEAALVSAHDGNGAPLRAVALNDATDLDGSSLVDAQWAILCNDAADHPDPLKAGSLARTMAALYPLMGGYAVTYELGGCVSWPAARQPLVDVHPRGAPPVLVVGNNQDPNTPLVGAQRLAADIAGARLAVWNGWGHTWLLSGSTDACMQGVVSGYLVGGKLPARGTVCR